MKTDFDLEKYDGGLVVYGGAARIIGAVPANKPYVAINAYANTVFIKDKDLERFAVNILKALKSDKLK